MLINPYFLIVSFFAAAVGTMAGFGSSTLLIPVALLFMDARSAVFLVASFHFFYDTFKLKIFWKEIDFNMFFIFGIPSIIFAFVGALLFSSVNPDALRRVAGVFLIMFSLASFRNPRFILKRNKLVAILGGGVSGLLAGLVGLGGAIRSSFLIAFDLSKEAYVATAAIIAFMVDAARIPTYFFLEAAQNSPHYIHLPFLLVTAFLGVRAGRYFLWKINQKRFKKIVLIALLLAGVRLLF